MSAEPATMNLATAIFIINNNDDDKNANEAGLCNYNFNFNIGFKCLQINIFPQHSIMQVQKKLVLYVGFETEAVRK